MRRSLLTLLTLGFASLAAAALALYFYARPAELKLAVVEGSADRAMMQAAARLLARDRAGIRFSLMPVTDAAAATHALDAGLADLAIGASDQHLPATAKTALVMRRNAFLLLAPAGKPASIADLAGKTIAIVTDQTSNTGHHRILDAILVRHEIAVDAVQRVEMDVASLEQGLRSGAADVVFVAGIAGDGPVSDAVHAVARAGSAEPVFIPVGHAHALVQQSSALEILTVNAGAFSGPQARPAQDLETVSYSVRMFASANLRDSTVGAVVKALFAMKPRLAAQHPLALRMQAPSTAKDAALPVHPGAAAYLDGDEESFFDRFSEFFYLGAMVLSILGSAVAAIANHLSSDAKTEYRAFVARLLEILRLARLADDPAVLRLLQAETDNIFTEFMSASARGKHDETRVANVGLVVSQVHQALQDRYVGLGVPGSASGRPGRLREQSVR